ncbi:MAG: hypothetical protein ACOVP1_03505 [Bacteroidia bacterium]
MLFKDFLIQLLQYHKIQFQLGDLKELNGFDGVYLNDKALVFLIKDEHSDLDKIQKLEDFSLKHQIRFIQINKEEFIQSSQLLKNRILSLFKIRNRIHGRLCEVQQITKSEADEFLQFNHSLGTTGAPNRYGLFYQQKLMAVACFSKAKIMTYEAIPYYSYVWERYASISDSTVIGGMSKLLNAFIKDSGAKHIMTYADLNWGTGNAFKKLGFKEVSRKQFNTGSNDFQSAQHTVSSLKYILDLR